MLKKKQLVLIGGGGHCKSVLDTAIRMNVFEKIVITDCGIPAGTEFMGYKVVGNDDILTQLFEDGTRVAFISLGSIKTTEQRQIIFQRAKNIGFEFPNLIDPSASVSKYSILGKGIFIGKNAVINAGVEIGDMAIINTGAIIEHGCYIGNFSHISVGAIVCGDSIIKDSVFVGANATVIQGITIGRNSVIGAGSVIIKDVDPNSKIIH